MKITITEAAYICGVTEQTIRNWTKSRGFPTPDDERRYEHQAVLDWANARAIRVAKLAR